MADKEPAAPPSQKRLDELASIANVAINNFRGDSRTLQTAIGMLFVGERYGWKVLLLIHDRKTVRKYEKILGIDVREEFPPVGDRAEKSLAWNMAQKVSNFWKAVRGEYPGIKKPDFD